MQSQTSTSKNFRKFIRGKISDKQTLQKAICSLYDFYCKVTGLLHMLPDFLIIGAEKSGTTSLYQYLVQHPNVYPARGKEIYFFDKKFSKGVNWYRLFFPFIWKNFFNKKFITGEATPRYFNHPLAPKRIAKLMPKVKIIILLRNPIDRAYSHYQMEWDYRREKLTFEKAIQEEEKRIEGEFEKMEKIENYYSPKYYWFSHLTAGMYINQIKRWMQFFEKEQFLIIKSEDLYEGPSSTFNQVLKFLNLSAYDLEKYGKFRSRDYDTMNPDTRSHLRDFFKPYNEQLYEFLGRDFAWK